MGKTREKTHILFKITWYVEYIISSSIYDFRYFQK